MVQQMGMQLYPSIETTWAGLVLFNVFGGVMPGFTRKR